MAVWLDTTPESAATPIILAQLSTGQQPISALEAVCAADRFPFGSHVRQAVDSALYDLQRAGQVTRVQRTTEPTYRVTRWYEKFFQREVTHFRNSA